ncbi:MAG: hypothetical protein Kow0056_08950 [Coriobacteriia bacterium]
MKATLKRLARQAAVLFLALLLVLPGTALATGSGGSGTRYGGGDGAAVSSGSGEGAQLTAALTQQRRERIRERITERLKRRKAAFDHATEVILQRISRLESIAAAVEKAGGDVGEVYGLLASARDLVAEAQDLEAEAAELFRAVPDSDDPRATFEEARDTAIAAVKKLREARAAVTQAIRALIDAIAELEV